MSIQDIAGNPLPNGTVGQMIGFAEPVAAEEELTLRIYRFLIEQIRIEDAKPAGALFVKRFLEGPQQIWADTQARIFSIKDLWNISKIEDDHLQFLKNIVGWTSDLDSITDRLEPNVLRKLIAASIPLWKERGTEEALQNVVELITGARTRVWNWFDFRWVLDETESGVEHEGRDPWIINLPGPPTLDEYYSNLRVVDDGILDRTLVEELVKLMRPTSERWEISYITFLDRFIIDGDDTQWFELPTGVALPTVLNGVASLTDGVFEHAVVTLPRALDWTNYVAYWRIKGTSAMSTDAFGGVFYWTDAGNNYLVMLETVTNVVSLVKVVGGFPTQIAAVDYFALTGGPIAPGTLHGLRAQVLAEGATNRIKIYVDANEVINVTDAAHSKGSAGFFHSVGNTGVELDELELFQVPLDTTLIDINP